MNEGNSKSRGALYSNEGLKNIFDFFFLKIQIILTLWFVRSVIKKSFSEENKSIENCEFGDWIIHSFLTNPKFSVLSVMNPQFPGELKNESIKDHRN